MLPPGRQPQRHAGGRAARRAQRRSGNPFGTGDRDWQRGEVFGRGRQRRTVPRRLEVPTDSTVGLPGACIATVLVGDIRDYTVLVRRAPSVELQQSVSRVFERLSVAVLQLGGTVKEYQGDAILAFWEGNLAGGQAVAACQAALALDRLGRDPRGRPRCMAASRLPAPPGLGAGHGPGDGGQLRGVRPTGLSLIGEPVVLAFRLEKFATDETGRIVMCPAERHGEGAFPFRNLGTMTPRGSTSPTKCSRSRASVSAGSTAATGSSRLRRNPDRRCARATRAAGNHYSLRPYAGSTTRPA